MKIGMSKAERGVKSEHQCAFVRSTPESQMASEPLSRTCHQNLPQNGGQRQKTAHEYEQLMFECFRNIYLSSPTTDSPQRFRQTHAQNVQPCHTRINPTGTTLVYPAKRQHH